MKVKRLGYSVKVLDVTNESLYEYVYKLAHKFNLKSEFTDGTTIKVTGDASDLTKFYKAI